MLQSQCRHDMGPPALPSVHLSVIGTSAAADEESFRGGGGREREGGDVDDVFSLIDNRPR